MKINKLDAHDRFKHLKAQDIDSGQCCQDMINQRPFGSHSFYIFCVVKTLGLDEKWKLWISGNYLRWEDIPEKRVIWQPRLTKPACVPNTMLFKVTPGTDIIKEIWVIPIPELWKQYGKGNLIEDESISGYIYDYEHNRAALERREDDDLSEEQIKVIYRDILITNQNKKSRQETSVSSLKLIYP